MYESGVTGESAIVLWVEDMCHLVPLRYLMLGREEQRCMVLVCGVGWNRNGMGLRVHVCVGVPVKFDNFLMRH